MASLSTNRKTKCKRILFSFSPSQPRNAIYLGRIPTKAANVILVRVEELISSKISNSSISTELASWVSGLGEELRSNLAKHGLVDKAANNVGVTLVQLVDQFVKYQVVKPATLAVYKQATNSLLNHFGGKTLISTIDVRAADEWRKSVEQSQLAEATVAKRIHTVKSIFSKALMWKMISVNPFSHLKPGSQQNRSRIHYVSRQIIEQVIAACSDAQSKAIIGLARFAGLRCPSEICPLKWKHIDFVGKKIYVTSPKTAKSGHDMRIVPLDPDLAKLLKALNPLTSEDSVISKIASASQNLRGMIMDAIQRADVKLWTRVFQNLRTSCEMEWNDKIGNPFVVSEWMGHSVKVAADHYNMVRSPHYNMISGIETTQITTQQPPVHPGKDVQVAAEIVEFSPLLHMRTTPYQLVRMKRMGGGGFEPPKAKPADLQSALVDRLSNRPIFSSQQLRMFKHTFALICPQRLQAITKLLLPHLYWRL